MDDNNFYCKESKQKKKDEKLIFILRNLAIFIWEGGLIIKHSKCQWENLPRVLFAVNK